jgi:hypothetical protein
VGWDTRQAESHWKTGTGARGTPIRPNPERGHDARNGDAQCPWGARPPRGSEAARPSPEEFMGSGVTGGDDPRVILGYHPVTAPSRTTSQRHPIPPEYPRGGTPEYPRGGATDTRGDDPVETGGNDPPLRFGQAYQQPSRGSPEFPRTDSCIRGVDPTRSWDENPKNTLIKLAEQPNTRGVKRGLDDACEEPPDPTIGERGGYRGVGGQLGSGGEPGQTHQIPGVESCLEGTAEIAAPSGTGKRGHTEGRFDWTKLIPGGGPDAALQKARGRNLKRLEEANENDGKILGKYLPSDVAAFFPFGVEGPDDRSCPPDEWVEDIMKVAMEDCRVPSKPAFEFGVSIDSIDHNTKLLEECMWDLDEALKRQKGSTVDHGSEFRSVDHLRRVVGGHPNFEFLEGMFQKGFEYHLTRELSEDERAEEFKAQFSRGNHRAATENGEAVRALLEGDVKHGFALPIRADMLHLLKGVHLQPGGMVNQMSLKADGSRKLKSRFTHDLTFSITSAEASVNQRVDMSRYPDMVYGWCLSRLLHYTAALRHRYPGGKIYIAKYDYSDAYKRISQSAKTAAATVVRFGDVAYVYLRMAFGGAPNPAGFSGFSETLTDLATELAMSSYSPEKGASPAVMPAYLEVRRSETDEAPMVSAILPALVVPVTLDSARDCFIDDVIDVYLDTPVNRVREGHLVQMAVHLMSRPHAGDAVEPVPRRPLLGPEKLEAEGRGSERQIVLGWEIRTREFVVALPEDKYIAWKGDLVDMINRGSGTVQEVESLVGRLNHASLTIPLSRHFLNDIRRKIPRVGSRVSRKQHLRFSKEELKDLRLWLEFLAEARRGISINVIVLRTPTQIAWSDSCPFGLGGYTLKGWAWRIRVPAQAPFYGDDAVNNVLEFLGMAVSALLLLEEARLDEEQFPCLLVLGDNTSAISWIFKSGKIAKTSRYFGVVKMIARHLASSVLRAGAKLCAQHLAGVTNKISDLLSFEGGCRGKVEPLTRDCPPNDILTDRLHRFHSQIIPSGFRIRPLPEGVELFALSAMQTIANSWTQRGKRHSSEATDNFGDGTDSSKIGVWRETPSSIRYPTNAKDCSWLEGSLYDIAPSTSMSRVELLQNVRDPWYRRLFGMPSAMWQRRSGNVVGPAPSTSRTESLLQDRCCTPK